jgi:hypothetical protein
MKKLSFLLLLLTINKGFAQKAPPLERLISIKISNEKIDEGLKIIEKAGGFNFSYNPDAIEVNRRISVNAQNQSVRQVLSEIFNNSLSFKNRGNYIILKKINEEPKKDFFVMGYVSDGETGLKIEKASIYEPLTLASAVTNQYGFYRIKLSTEINQVNLLVRKQNYQNESVSIKSKQDKMLNIRLLPTIIEEIETPKKTVITTPEIIRPISIRTDTLIEKKLDSIPIPKKDTVVINPKPETSWLKNTIDWRAEWESAKEILDETSEDVMQWFLNKKQSIHTRNIGDTLFRPVQISFLPYIGTNHVMSGNVVNNVSLNIIAGYSMGVRTLELGGFMNLVRRDVYGVQGAGFMNIVGRDVKGVQAAGFMNINGRNTFGVQLAGFGNVNAGNSGAVQMAGFANFNTKSFYGIQNAGFMNTVGGDMKLGLQIAGFQNIVRKNAKGIQVAGFANNVGRDFDGIQVSGFLNIVGKTHNGLQVGIINVAKKVVYGSQIGVVNVAKESKGLPIGLISFVGNGYKRLEFNTEELMTTNFTFKTGVKHFYNIFTVGYNQNNANRPAMSWGYGLGTAAKLSKRFWVNLDVTSSHLQMQRNEIYWGLNQLNKASLGLEFRPIRRFSIFVAPTVNLLASENTDLDFGGLKNLKISQNEGTWFGRDATLSSWVGFQVGLRICSRD